MALPPAAIAHYRQQQAISVRAAEQVTQLWRRVGDDFDLGWSLIGSNVFSVVLAAQQAIATTAIAYVPSVLEQQHIDAPPVADVDAGRFAGGTRDGRPVETLLHGAVYNAKAQVAAGQDTRGALAAAGGWLQSVVLDSVRDSGRQATAAAYTVRPQVQGWVRMLNPPSCKYCVNLAGKFYRWNQGFAAHPHCDCVHIPTSESRSGDLTVDPYAYFRSLDEKTQDRVWGRADAQAIRDGADIHRVVNIRSRGLADDALKSTPGHNRGWQARRYDTPSKMTVDDIYAVAQDRDDAIRLMRENGFITGEQVPGGNIIGNQPSLYGDFAAGKLGRGGARVGATAAYRKAVATGVRDPLEPATQTAAESRFYTVYLMKQAVDHGRDPFSTSGGAVSQSVRELVNRQYQRQLAGLAGQPQVLELARLLGVA